MYFLLIIINIIINKNNVISPVFDSEKITPKIKINKKIIYKTIVFLDFKLMALISAFTLIQIEIHRPVHR